MLKEFTLTCDIARCKEWLVSTSVREVMERARARGWRLYDGPNLAGDKVISQHLCPVHSGQEGKREAKRLGPMPEDQPLF